MLALAIVIFILFFYLAWRRPVLALSAMAALLPAYNLRFAIFGLPTTILEFIIWGAFLGWILNHLSLRGAERRGNLDSLKTRLQKIKWPLALFFLASIISVFTAPNLYKAFGLWRAFFLEPGFIFLMILAVIKNKKTEPRSELGSTTGDFSKIIFGLSVSAFFVSAIAIGQRFFGLPILPPWDKELRAMSVFTQPNMVGLYLGPIIILMLGQIIQASKKPLTTYYLLLTTILSLTAIILAQSDGAIAGVLAALAVFCLLWNKKTRLFLLFSAILLTTCYLLSPNNNFPFIKEKLLFHDWSGFVRQNIWKESWTMLKDNWLLGGGVGGYPVKILPYHASRDWMEVYPMPHNIIFNFWSELGLLGLAAFLWLLEKFSRMCYALFKSPPLWKKETRGDLFAITAISAMTAIIIHGLVDVPILKNDLSILFWIIFSMPIIMSSSGVIPDTAVPYQIQNKLRGGNIREPG